MYLMPQCFILGGNGSSIQLWVSVLYEQIVTLSPFIIQAANLQDGFVYTNYVEIITIVLK